MGEYEVELPGGVVTRMQLNDADAKLLGAKEPKSKEATKPANKARTVANKEG